MTPLWKIKGLGCHFLHFALHWMKAEPQHSAISGLPVSGDAADENLSLLLDFGSRGTFNLLYTSKGAPQYPKEHFEVWGGGKTGVLEDFRRSVVHPGKKEFKSSGQDKRHAAEVRRTLEAALSGTTPPLDLNELMSTHRWLFAIEKQLREGAN